MSPMLWHLTSTLLNCLHAFPFATPILHHFTLHPPANFNIHAFDFLTLTSSHFIFLSLSQTPRNYLEYTLTHATTPTILPHLLHALNTFQIARPLPVIIPPYPFHVAFYHSHSHFHGPLPFAFYITPLLILQLLRDAYLSNPANLPLALYFRLYLLPLRLLCDYLTFAANPVHTLAFLFQYHERIPYFTYTTFAPLFYSTRQTTYDPKVIQFYAFVASFRFPTPSIVYIHPTDFEDYFNYVFPTHHTHPIPIRPRDIPPPFASEAPPFTRQYTSSPFHPDPDAFLSPQQHASLRSFSASQDTPLSLLSFAHLFNSPPLSPLSSPPSSIVEAPRIVELFDDTDIPPSHTMSANDITMQSQQQSSSSSSSSSSSANAAPPRQFIPLLTSHSDLQRPPPPPHRISTSTQTDRRSLFSPALYPRRVPNINLPNLETAERVFDQHQQQTVADQSTSLSTSQQHIPFPQTIPAFQSHQQHNFTIPQHHSSIPTFSDFQNPQNTPVFPSTSAFIHSARNPAPSTSSTNNLLFPRTDQVSLESILTAERRVNFTQEDIDNFCRTNPNTLGKHRVDTFVNHLDTLYQNSSHIPDAKVEAEALRRLQVHLDHVSLATLMQTFLDSNANLAFPKTAFWRNAQFQNAQLCHRPPPERNNLAASLNTLTRQLKNGSSNNSFNNQNRNNNSNFRNNNSNRNFNNNTNNSNNNRNNNRNFNNSRNTPRPWHSNGNNRNNFGSPYRNNNSNNSSHNSNNNNNRSSGHTPVQQTHFNTKNNSNSNNRSSFQS